MGAGLLAERAVTAGSGDAGGGGCGEHHDGPALMALTSQSRGTTAADLMWTWSAW